MDTFVESFISNGIEHKCNHFEFNVLASNTRDETSNNNFETHNTSILKEEFYSHLTRLMSCDHRYTQKQYKEIVIGTTYYHNHKNEDTYVFNLQTRHVDMWRQKWLASAHAKNKLTLLSVPSTKSVHSEMWVKQLTFHVTNRIFINFINGCNTTKFYKVCVVYNHEKNVDTPFMIKTLCNVLKQFQVS